jgi:hypothetical protein
LKSQDNLSLSEGHKKTLYGLIQHRLSTSAKPKATVQPGCGRSPARGDRACHGAGPCFLMVFAPLPGR